jgi:hypothetical protein
MPRFIFLLLLLSFNGVIASASSYRHISRNPNEKKLRDNFLSIVGRPEERLNPQLLSKAVSLFALLPRNQSKDRFRSLIAQAYLKINDIENATYWFYFNKPFEANFLQKILQGESPTSLLTVQESSRLFETMIRCNDFLNAFNLLNNARNSGHQNIFPDVLSKQRLLLSRRHSELFYNGRRIPLTNEIRLHLAAFSHLQAPSEQLPSLYHPLPLVILHPSNLSMTIEATSPTSSADGTTAIKVDKFRWNPYSAL